jgi:predicted amidohydrolase YtcJ
MAVLRGFGRVVPLAVLTVGCAAAPRCDRLFVGGVLELPAGSVRREVAVSGGRIVALVEPEEARRWQSAAGEVVDLAGARVYPGFTESHGHLTGYGAALEVVDLRGTSSLDELVERARAAASRRPAGGWVIGRGWDQNLWPGRAMPHHRALSAALPDQPALLRRVDGHAVLTNARGLTLAGITASTPDPAGGRILRDARGEPTGVLVDAAIDLLGRLLPPPDEAEVERQIVGGAQALAAVGLTEIHDAGTGRMQLAALRRLQAAGRLPIRVYVMLDSSDEDLLADELARGPETTGDGMLAVRAVKLLADGALGSRGALLSAPYSDEPATSGLDVTGAAALAAAVRRATGASFQPAVHAIGDAAVTLVLDLYEHEIDDRPGVRPRIEHAQVVRPGDVPRFASLGVLAAVQPTHCTSDMPWAPQRLGVDRTPWAYRWRSLLDAGARLALGSDVPVESADPRLGLWAAVTRRPPEGTAHEGWNLPEALSLAEAIAGYTTWAAWAGFEEDWRGAIAPGYAADLTVLDRALDPADPASILQARVVRTVVAGRDAFVAGSQT